MSLQREAQVYHNPEDPDFGSFILSSFVTLDENHAKQLAKKCVEIEKAAGHGKPHTINDHVDRMKSISTGRALYVNARAPRLNPDWSQAKDMFGIGYLSLQGDVAVVEGVDILPEWGREEVKMQGRGVGSAIINYMTAGLEPTTSVALAIEPDSTSEFGELLERKGFKPHESGGVTISGRVIYSGHTVESLQAQEIEKRSWLARSLPLRTAA